MCAVFRENVYVKLACAQYSHVTYRERCGVFFYPQKFFFNFLISFFFFALFLHTHTHTHAFRAELSRHITHVAQESNTRDIGFFGARINTRTFPAAIFSLAAADSYTQTHTRALFKKNINIYVCVIYLFSCTRVRRGL